MAIFSGIVKSSCVIGGAKGVLNYVAKKADKTLGINCSDDYKQALGDFQDTKRYYNKLNGRQYKHYVLSFDKKDNIPQDKILEIAAKIAMTNFKGHEVFLALHTDTNNPHCHMVVNSVNFQNGYKFQQSSKDLKNTKENINILGKEYGFELTKKDKQIGEIRANSKEKLKTLEKDFLGKGKSDLLTTYKILNNVLKTNDIQSSKELGEKLKENGVNLTWEETRKNVTLELDQNISSSKKNKFRLSNLEKTFSDPRLEKDFLEKIFEKNRELEISRKLLEQQKSREAEQKRMKERERGGYER